MRGEEARRGRGPTGSESHVCKCQPVVGVTLGNTSVMQRRPHLAVFAGPQTTTRLSNSSCSPRAARLGPRPPRSCRRSASKTFHSAPQRRESQDLSTEICIESLLRSGASVMMAKGRDGASSPSKTHPPPSPDSLEPKALALPLLVAHHCCLLPRCLATTTSLT